jgi:hypothetical protein
VGNFGSWKFVARPQPEEEAKIAKIAKPPLFPKNRQKTQVTPLFFSILTNRLKSVIIIVQFDKLPCRAMEAH